jgi:hypothetical protein
MVASEPGILEIMAGQCLAGAMLKTPRAAGIAIEQRVKDTERQEFSHRSESVRSRNSRASLRRRKGPNKRR